jgi:hypothetical protein
MFYTPINTFNILHGELAVAYSFIVKIDI